MKRAEAVAVLADMTARIWAVRYASEDMSVPSDRYGKEAEECAQLACDLFLAAEAAANEYVDCEDDTE